MIYALFSIHSICPLGTISHAFLELIFHRISVLPLYVLETWDVLGFLVNQTTTISKDNDWFSFGHMSYMYLCVCVCGVSSVQFSHSVASDSLRPHESQHARPPCPSPTPGVHSDSCPSSQWCHLAISSSVVPFSSCPQSLPASESFPMSQLFAWGGQSTGVSERFLSICLVSVSWISVFPG